MQDCPLATDKFGATIPAVTPQYDGEKTGQAGSAKAYEDVRGTRSIGGSAGIGLSEVARIKAQAAAEEDVLQAKVRADADRAKEIAVADAETAALIAEAAARAAADAEAAE